MDCSVCRCSAVIADIISYRLVVGSGGFFYVYSKKSSFLTFLFFFFQAEDGIRDLTVTGVQTCALPIFYECRSVIKLVDGIFISNFRLHCGVYWTPSSGSPSTVNLTLFNGASSGCVHEIGRASCRERV